MERYTANEALAMVTDTSGLADDEESDIEEESEFLLPHLHDEPDAELEPAAIPSPSPAPSISHSPLPASPSTSTSTMQPTHAAGRYT